MKLKKNDIYLILSVLAAALLLFCWQRYFLPRTGEMIIVERNGEPIGRYSLNSEQRLVFADESGRRNVLVIQNGKAFMEEADCPDKLCVKQKAIDRNGESIICLPHRLVVRISGGESGEVDAVADAGREFHVEERRGYEKENG